MYESIPCDMPNQTGTEANSGLARNVRDAPGDFLVSHIFSRGKAGNPPKSGQQGSESGSPDRGSSVCIFVGHVDRLALGPGVRGSIRYLESGSGSHPMGKKKF